MSPRRAVRAAALLLAVLVAGMPVTAQERQPGSLRGNVYDKDFGSQLDGARVSIMELRVYVTTGSDGSFLFPKVPAGSYTLTISRDGFARQVLTDVVVTAGQLTDRRIELSSEVIDLEEIVVTGADPLADSEVGLLEIRMEAVTVQDSLSAEIISKAGASDAAGALKFVVGASVAGGKYATVRGLSDRYTGTTLNGVRVPSPDPRRRAVQLDLFPTGTIDTVTVTKSFTPDLQGEFTGGGVDIRTKSIPDGPNFSMTVAGGYNTAATGNDGFLTYEQGGISLLGYDSGDRALPSIANDPLPTFPRFSTRPTPAQIQASNEYDALVGAFTPVMGTMADAPGLDSGVGLTGGNRFEFSNGAVIGVTGSLTYARKYDFYDEAMNNNAVVSDPNQPITVTSGRLDSKGVEEVLLGVLGNVEYVPTPEHHYALKLILNESAEDEARFQTIELSPTSVEQNQTLRYTERTIGSAQVHGNHLFRDAISSDLGRFKDLEMDWFVSDNRTRQDEPDVRFFRNNYSYSNFSGTRPSNATDAQITRRIFREIQEGDLQGAINVALPFTQWTESPGRIKAGIYADSSDREYVQNSYTYTFATQFGSPTNPAVAENTALSRFRGNSRDDLWTDVFLDENRTGLATNSPPAPNQLLWTIAPIGEDVNYNGDQDISAVYLMGELPLGPKFRLIGGARLEKTAIGVDPFNEPFGTVDIITVLPSGDREISSVPQEDAAADIEDTSILPSFGAIWEIVGNMNLRGSWSRTLARPTFRELAPVATEEFLFGDEYIGNFNLTLSHITNYDLRWEWFRRAADVFAASVFYKDITDPIETISFAASNRSFLQPVNFESGRVYGIELETRVGMDLFFASLTGLAVGANLAVIESEVNVPDSEQRSLASYALDTETRRLYGQPDYLFNLNLTYDHERLGISAGAFYNLTGDMLVSGAARGTSDGNPDVFEEAFGALDVTFRKAISRNFTVGFRGRNLLARDIRSVYRTPDGQEAVKFEREVPPVYTISMSFKL